MSSEPGRRRSFRLALPQEIAWKSAFEATSHTVLGGLRHIRTEAVKKRDQVVEAIDNVRREAGHRLQNCLSHVERPVSSTPAFAAISGRFRPNPIGELALDDKQLEKKLAHIFVHVVMSPKEGLLGLAADDDSRAGSFVFMSSHAASAYIRRVKKQWTQFEERDLRVVTFPLHLFHYYFVKKRYRGKLPTYFFVPDVEEVYYATKLKEIFRSEERRREELIEIRNAVIKEEKEKAKAEKAANKKKKKKGREKKAPPPELLPEEKTESPPEEKTESPPEEKTESPAEPPPPPPPPEENAEEKDGKKEDSEEKDGKESPAKLTEQKEVEETEPGMNDIVVKGVPVYSCTGLVLSGRDVVPYFMSYRDLDCFMRATFKNTFRDAVRQRDGAFELFEKAEDACREELKKLKGEEAAQMQEQLRIMELNRNRMLYSHYHLPMRIAEAGMNVEVTDLETLLEKWAKMRPKEADKVMLYGPGTFYINHNEEEDFYDGFARHMDRTLNTPPQSPTIVPDHLLD